MKRLHLPSGTSGWPVLTVGASVALIVSLFLRWEWVGGDAAHYGRNAWDVHPVAAVIMTAAGVLGIWTGIGALRGSKQAITGLRAGGALVLTLIGAALTIYYSFHDRFPGGSGPGTTIAFTAAIVVADGNLRVVRGLRRQRDA